MKKICYSILSLCICVLVANIQTAVASIEDISKISDVIIKNVQGKVVEYGFKYEVTGSNINKNQCDIVYKKLFWNKQNIKSVITKKNNIYNIEFSSNNINGYLQYIEDDGKKIIIDVEKKDDKDNLNKLKSDIEKVLNLKKCKYTCFQYIKAKINNDMVHTNDIVINILKEIRASNVKSIRLTNGYNITALTGLYEPMKNGDESIDINCAVSRYKSGIYIIIGNPVISTSY